MNNSKPVLIAVPTNDGTTVFPKMPGMAKYFNIYSATDGKQFTFIEKRANPYETTMQQQKTLDVYAVIHDCKIITSYEVFLKLFHILATAFFGIIYKFVTV
ncbi:MAG: hypothetical protein LC658_13635 [Bacteroidales bacterium]|nr:hypothetical protein [Bacteroidales bacterium]